MTLPTIHLNGSHPDRLCEDISAAAHAVHDAIAKLAAACPHARDYYVQGERAIWDAMREHGDRMLKLTEVYRELQEIHESIVDQKLTREAARTRA